VNKVVFCISFIFLFTSCDYFSKQETKSTPSDIIAIVNTQKLFKKDIEALLPKDISKEDSTVIVRSYINDWAIKQLLLNKAENTSSLKDLNEIDDLVRSYRETLLINKYKETLIQQQLDTVISEEEVEKYYETSKENFKLNEELIKVKYLHFDNNVINKKELIKWFKSDAIEDAEELEKQQLSFKSYDFNDSIWKPLDKVMLKLPFSKENLLKKTKLLQQEDSLGVYLATIQDVLVRNDVAPKSYIEPTIKQMILHKRKKELIRKIENTLIKDATKNNNFKVY